MRVVKLVAVLAVALFVSSSAWAQSAENSKVTGVVTDSTGASIAGAQIQMTQTATATVRTGETNADGSYTIPELPAGAYQLSVKKEGFNAYVQNGIILEVGSSPTLNVTLQVGAVTQEVTVTANAALVETHSSTLGQVVNQQEVLDIPLNARDPMQLLTLTPAAVVSTGFSNQFNFPTPYTVAFLGTNPTTGNYLLDGGVSNDYTQNNAFPLPFPDALQEFKAETSAVPAQYGMHSSAVINAITKSGSNEFHGDAFEFVRNNDFNARQYYALKRDPLKRNQYGGVVGGPIKKDKAFFFGAVQRTTVRDQANSLAILPTANELAGNWMDALSAICNNGKPATLKGGATTMVLPTAYSVPAVNLAHLLPQIIPTQDPNDCGTYDYTVKIDTNNFEGVGKVDYHLSDKHSMFVRYFDANYIEPADPTSFLTLDSLAQHTGYQTWTIGDTYLVSPTVVNSVHITVDHALNRKGEIGWPTPTDVGVGVGGAGFYNPIPQSISVTVGSDFGVGSSSLVPVYFNPTVEHYAEDMEVTKGAHQLAFGAMWTHFNENEISATYTSGAFTFSGATTGNPIYDYLLGDLSGFEQGNTFSMHPTKRFIALYGQDSWQVNRKLTVNYGVRWEPYIQGPNRDGQGEHFNLADFIANIHSGVFPNAPAGLLFPTVAGHIGTPDYPGYGTYAESTWTHFEPRVGFSFDPRGKGREVVRASYGTFYDYESGVGGSLGVTESAPWGDFVTLIGDNFTDPWKGFTFNGHTGNPFPLAQPPSGSASFPSASTYLTYYDLKNKAPMLQQWNLGFQKQFGSSWSVTASYVGNHSVHTFGGTDGNPGVYIPGTNCTVGGNFPAQTLANGTVVPAGLPDGVTKAGACSTSSNTQNRRILTLLNPSQGPLYGTLGTDGDFEGETFNGGIFTVQKRLSNNFSFTANYTFSHCIDNGDSGGTGGSGNRAQLAGRIGNCLWDHRHQFTINGAIRSPEFHSGLVEAIAGHWQIAPIFSYLSPDWLTIVPGTDVALTGDAGNQRPNIIGNPYAARTPLTNGTFGVHFFNPSAYALPTLPAGSTGNVINENAAVGNISVGPLGNLPRQTQPGAPNKNFDVALTREFKINERNMIQARIEAFNLFNLVRYYDPVTAFNSPLFGTSTTPTAIAYTPGFSTPQDPRIMQFALKWVF